MTESQLNPSPDLGDNDQMTLEDFQWFISEYGIQPQAEITPEVFNSFKRAAFSDPQIRVAVINGVIWMRWLINHYQEQLRQTLMGRIVLFLIKRALKNG